MLVQRLPFEGATLSAADIFDSTASHTLPCSLWSLLRSWLHRGISQEKLPLYLGFFQFVHNTRRRGKALLGSLIEALVA